MTVGTLALILSTDRHRMPIGFSKKKKKKKKKKLLFRTTIFFFLPPYISRIE